jgi:hypothetical protein
MKMPKWVKDNLIDLGGDDQADQQVKQGSDARVIPKSPPGVVTSSGAPGNSLLQKYRQGVITPMVAASTSQPGSVAKVDDQFFETIIEALGEAPLSDGFRVMVEMFISLSDTIPDPKLRLQAAFKTAQRMHGLTKAQLLKDLEAQRLKLDQERSEFNDSISQESTTRKADSSRTVGDLGSQISAAEKDLQGLEAEYQAAKREITGRLTTLREQKTAQEQVMNSVDTDVNNTRALFQTAADAVENGSEAHNWIGIKQLQQLAQNL